MKGMAWLLLISGCPRMQTTSSDLEGKKGGKSVGL